MALSILQLLLGGAVAAVRSEINREEPGRAKIPSFEGLFSLMKNLFIPTLLRFLLFAHNACPAVEGTR